MSFRHYHLRQADVSVGFGGDRSDSPLLPLLRPMHICACVDRPCLNWHVRSQARLLNTNALKCHDRRSSHRTCCSCSASASECSADNYHFQSHQTGNATRCIDSAKRALKRAFGRDRSLHPSDHECCQAAPVSCQHSRPSRYST